MVPSKAVLMRPLCFKTIAQLSCRLTDALRICKVLHKCADSAPAKKLKVNLTLPQEVDQTTTMYSGREPSNIAILFCCQA